MSIIENGVDVNSPYAQAMDMSKVNLKHVSEMPEDTYQSYLDTEEKRLRSLYTGYANPADNPRNQEYATVKVDGKIVATIYNNGSVESSKATANSLKDLLEITKINSTGPALAEDRAAKIAEQLGGEVAKSSSAISNTEYADWSNASSSSSAAIDFDGMKNDPYYERLNKIKEARVLFLAQKIGQETSGNTAVADNLFLDTNQGKKGINLDEYFNPTPRAGPVDISEVPLIFPTAENINALTKHAESKFKNLLYSYGIPEGPSEISFDREGKIQLPDDYAYKDELKQALEENPAMTRELSTIAALTSHYVGMQAASKGNQMGGYAKITLDFDADGKLKVSANAKPYGGAKDAGAHHAATAYDNASPEADETEKASENMTAEEWFQDYMKKTPEQRYYEALLRKKGLTPEELEALPPEERLKIEEEIQAEMKERAENKVDDLTQDKVA